MAVFFFFMLSTKRVTFFSKIGLCTDSNRKNGPFQTIIKSQVSDLYENISKIAICRLNTKTLQTPELDNMNLESLGIIKDWFISPKSFCIN